MTKKEHTSAYKIFHYYYQCQIPQHYLYSQEYMEVFGLPTTGQSDVDRELSQSMVPAQLTIAQMAEYLDEGASIVLIDPYEAATIYGIVNDHLENWRVHTVGFGGLEVPMEDLRKLDALAKEVFKVGRAYLPQPEKEDPINRFFDTMDSRRGTRRTWETHAPTRPSEHKPISELIAKETFKRRSSRWR